MIELDQGLIEDISEVTYKNVFVYRYLTEKLFYVEDEDELINNSAYSGKNPPLLQMKGSEYVVETVLKSYYERLEPRDYLFIGGMFRKNIGGELVHTALDPYIDLLDASKYTMIEPCNEINSEIPLHTINCHPILRNHIVNGYGIDRIDLAELEEAMNDSLFPVVERFYALRLPHCQKESILSSLQWSLALRRAYMSFYEEVIRRVAPKVVLHSHGTSRNCCYAYEVAKRNGIPCIEIDHGAIIHTRRYTQNSKYSDLHFSFSDLAEKSARDLGVTNVRAVGKPGVLQKGEDYAGLNMRITVVCVISSCEQGLLEKAGILSEMLPSESYIVMYKRHSAEKWDEETDGYIRKTYSRLKVMEFGVDINDIYRISHIVIGEKSTALLEAIPYEHIKILINKRRNDTSLEEGGCLAFFEQVVNNEEMIYTESVDEMYKEIMSYDRLNNFRPKGDIYWHKDPEKSFLKSLECFHS
ncbi:MAG: hypothetical protein K5891_02605 [Lachnospiraceae bacterium]|nr:hypothetical protein [Lachnospiraceae bacterium]